MYADLRKHRHRVQLANPGFIRTRLTAKNDFTMPFIMEPEAAADIMFRHMQSNRFKISFPTAFQLALPRRKLPAGLALLPDVSAG